MTLLMYLITSLHRTCLEPCIIPEVFVYKIFVNKETIGLFVSVLIVCTSVKVNIRSVKILSKVHT